MDEHSGESDPTATGGAPKPQLPHGVHLSSTDDIDADELVSKDSIHTESLESTDYPGLPRVKMPWPPPGYIAPSELPHLWYAVCTRPRFEKKTRIFLEREEIPNWLPLQRSQRQWSDRKKMVDVPVFNSYIFVHITENDFYRTLNTYGVSRFVYYNGKPAVVPDRDIDFLRRIFDEGYELEARPIAFQPGMRVRITRGAFVGREGILVAEGNRKRFRVDLKQIGQSILFDFTPDALEPIEVQVDSSVNSAASE
jgi:transcription antitermination factor NusG